MNQACPLCGINATYEHFHEPYTKLMHCPTCGEYFIDAHSERFMRSTTVQFRAEASASTKAGGSDYRVVFREPREAERKNQPHPRLMLITETRPVYH